jgi:hypothetical protein
MNKTSFLKFHNIFYRKNLIDRPTIEMELKFFVILVLAILNVHSKLAKAKSSHNRLQKSVWFNNYEKYYMIDSYFEENRGIGTNEKENQGKRARETK